MTEEKKGIWGRIISWLRGRLARHLKKEKPIVMEAFDEWTDVLFRDIEAKFYEDFDVPEEVKPYIKQFLAVANKESDEQFDKFFDLMIEYIEG